MTTYQADGSVRGSCGHNHKTAGAAWRCANRDQHDCGNLGGGAYSDRAVVRSDGEPLSADDMDSIDAAQKAVYGY
jgi:hypothetical protein